MGGLEIAETHVGRSHSAVYNVCSADLTVPVLHGAIIEGVATLICRLGSRLVALKDPQYATAIDSFIATSMVCRRSPPAAATSTPSSQPPSSLDAGATPRWSTLLSTGWDPASAPSPPSPSGLMLKRPSL